jgi:hypothetical protein
MGVSLIGLCIAAMVLISHMLYPNLVVSLTFLRMPFISFFGLVMLGISFPWRYLKSSSSSEKNAALKSVMMRSCQADRALYLYRYLIYIVSFLAILVSSIVGLSSITRFAYAIASVGIVLDCLRGISSRIQLRISPLGLSEYVLGVMNRGEKESDHEKIRDGFESTFSIIFSYLKNGDMASLKIFCTKISGRLDSWIRMSTKLPVSLEELKKEGLVLDRYTIVEAMVAKRFNSILLEALQSTNSLGLETIIWFEGKFVLAFHKKHPSLGYLLLFSLANTLQLSEGKIDRVSRQAEYVTLISEIIKAYIDHSAMTNVSDKISIIKALALLENHLKDIFQLDRKMNPAFLMQPIAEIGQLIADERYVQMPDREDIVAELRRILSQFAILETIRAEMQMSGEGTDTKASYHEDKPFLPTSN